MNTINPNPLSASGGHHDDDNNATTGSADTGSSAGAGGFGTAQAFPTQAASTQAASTQTAATRTFPDQPLYEPLPYGTGFASPQPLGFGVGPVELGIAASGSTGSAVEVAERKRSGSPILAVAGLLSMAVAVWAILGAPVIAPIVLLAAGLVLTVLVGLVMVIRR